MTAQASLMHAILDPEASASPMCKFLQSLETDLPNNAAAAQHAKAAMECLMPIMQPPPVFAGPPTPPMDASPELPTGSSGWELSPTPYPVPQLALPGFAAPHAANAPAMAPSTPFAYQSVPLPAAPPNLPWAAFQQQPPAAPQQPAPQPILAPPPPQPLVKPLAAYPISAAGIDFGLQQHPMHLLNPAYRPLLPVQHQGNHQARRTEARRQRSHRGHSWGTPLTKQGAEQMVRTELAKVRQQETLLEARLLQMREATGQKQRQANGEEEEPPPCETTNHFKSFLKETYESGGYVRTF